MTILIIVEDVYGHHTIVFKAIRNELNDRYLVNVAIARKPFFPNEAAN